MLYMYIHTYVDASIDGDDPDHILWIFERAQERADEFGIQGVNYRLTQGVYYVQLFAKLRSN